MLKCFPGFKEAQNQLGHPHCSGCHCNRRLAGAVPTLAWRSRWGDLFPSRLGWSWLGTLCKLLAGQRTSSGLAQAPEE